MFAAPSIKSSQNGCNNAAIGATPSAHVPPTEASCRSKVWIMSENSMILETSSSRRAARFRSQALILGRDRQAGAKGYIRPTPTSLPNTTCALTKVKQRT
jgi:hypothetical protein